MKRKLQINNVSAKVSADELEELCEMYGTVVRIEWSDEWRAGSRCSGYV